MWRERNIMQNPKYISLSDPPKNAAFAKKKTPARVRVVMSVLTILFIVLLCSRGSSPVLL